MIFRALRYTLCKNRRNCSETEALFITCVTNVGRIITAFEPREDYSSLGHMQGRRGRAGGRVCQCNVCCAAPANSPHATTPTSFPNSPRQMGMVMICEYTVRWKSREDLRVPFLAWVQCIDFRSADRASQIRRGPLLDGV